MFGIDLSHHNNGSRKISAEAWKNIKAAAEFVIIRDGFGKELFQKDKQFENNYVGARAAGIENIGAYHYSYALTPEAAAKEAHVCLEILGGKQFGMPVFFDVEEPEHAKLSGAELEEIAKAFITPLEAAGYWTGFYSFDSMFCKLSEVFQRRYACWVASVSTPVRYCKHYGIWQNSWSGHIDDVAGDIDTNICYRDYPAAIKYAGKNGYKAMASPQQKPKTKMYTVTAARTGVTEEKLSDIVTSLQVQGFTVATTAEE